MNRIITKQELWNLPNEQISELTKGRIIKIFTNNGENKEVRIRNFLAAANHPHLFVGFLTEDARKIHIQDIDYVEL